MEMRSPVVEEVPGLYGAVSMSELLLQKLWHRRDFSQDGLVTEDGRPIKVINQGSWNRQEGPDFLNAELEIGGQRTIGDVEVHFHARDWRAHGHTANPRFARVVLHVVLFPPTSGRKDTICSSPPLLVLLPYLKHDLEDYAAMEELGALDEARDRAEQWLHFSVEERRSQIIRYAEKRLLQKCHYARSRLQKDGWEHSCHTLFLEALGYRRNRAPMANLAMNLGLGEMLSAASHSQETATVATRLFESVSGWKLAGLRPANHPRKRIAEYLQLLQRKADWASRLQTYFFENAKHLPVSQIPTAAYRKQIRLTQMRAEIVSILGSVWNGPKLDTLVVDVFLPLLIAQDSRSGEALGQLWYHWFAGDAPEAWRLFLDSCHLLSDRAHPISNGAYQGAFLALLEG